MDMIPVGDRLNLAFFAKAELSMRDSKHFRSELTTEKEELCESEDKRDRICELYAELIDREGAA